MVKASTTSRMHTPGGTRYHQAPIEAAPWVKAASSIEPGDPRGSRKARVVSDRMATATIRTVLAKISGTTLGRMAADQVPVAGAEGPGPLDVGPEVTARAWARTILAVPGQEVIPMTKAMLASDGRARWPGRWPGAGTG